MTPNTTLPRIGSDLTAADLAILKAVGVSASTAIELARIRRVTHQQSREHCGITYKSAHLEGLAFPYWDPDDEDRARTYRVRRDHPEMGTDGKPIAKYVSPPDRRYLYFCPNAYSALADTSRLCIVVESEKAVLAIGDAEVPTNRPHALTFATGGCWGWRGVIGKTTSPNGARVDEKGVLPDIERVTWTDRDTVICFDSNAATNDKVHAARRALAAELEKRGAKVRIADIPVEVGVNGPDDYIGRHGAAAFFSTIIDAAQPAKRTSGKSSAKPEKAKQGRDVIFEDIEPWDEPVNGPVLLDALRGTFERYVALPTHASIALSLWAMFTHVFNSFFASPTLAITSPQKRCGKTVLLIVLGGLVPRRMFAANVTPAVLFRTIEKYGPTLLIDEADTFIRDNEELRGVLNSGHTRTTAVVIRAVGDDHDPRAFSTWCPKAIALIGKLPGTLEDRSIAIPMRRRTTGEHVDRLRQDRIDGQCHPLRRQAQRWADDHRDALQDADPQVPEALHDRAADCWRPLLAIADAVGGAWPQLARDAALALSGEMADDDAGTKLLADIFTIFMDEGDPDVLGSTTIIEKLVGMDDRPWSEWSHGRPMTTAKLSRILSGYDIHPAGVVRIGNKTPRGYRRSAFEDAWLRYGALKAQQRNKPNEYGAEPADPKRNIESACCTSQSATNPMNTEECCTVALSEGGKSPATGSDHTEVPDDGGF